MTLNQNIKKYFLPALLLVALAIAFLKPSTDNLHSVAQKIQSKLNEREADFVKAASDKKLREAFEKGDEDAALVEELEKKNILLYYYRNDSLLHWTSNMVLPFTSPSALDENTSGA